MSISKKKLLATCKDLYQQQRWAELLEHTERAIRQKIHSDDVLLLNMAGAAARAVGDQVKAERFWDEALKHDPKNPHVLNNMGIAHRESGRLDSALKYFQRAIEVAPTAAIHNNLGVLFYNLRRFKDAADEYQKAVKINPQYAEAWANLGNALKDLHHSALALKAYDKAIELNPNFAWALSCMAHIQQKLANPTKSIEYANRAREIDPENAEIQLTSLNTLLPLRPQTESEGADYLRAFAQRLEELSRWADTATRLKKLGERVGYSQPYFIAYRRGNHKEILSRYGQLMCNASKAYRPNVKMTAPPFSGSRKIRFGIFSGFIYRHSVWDIILKGIVLNLEQSKFELIICHTGSITDDQTEIAKGKSNLYIQGPKTHDDWVKTLMGLNLDVLMYPEIGMDPYSMQMATLRIAPLQMTSWGHPMTSGLPTLDWYLSGDLLEPAQAQEHYTEKLIRLSGVGVCTYQLEIQPRQLILKNDSGNAIEGKVYLYLCQHAFKYTDEAIELLAKVAKDISNAVYLIVKDNKYPEAFNIAIDQLRKKFEELNLDHVSRIFLLPWMNRSQFLGSFKHVHIYLDLPGFSGYTTAWQALSQGCPVVTLEGDFLRQRLASGLLRAIGEIEYIAEDEKKYVEIISILSIEVIEAADEFANRRNKLKEKIKELNEDVTPVRQLESQIIGYFEPNVRLINHLSSTEHAVSSASLTTHRRPSPLYLAQLSDVNYMKSNATQFSNREVFSYDPYIVEAAYNAGFRNCHLKRLNLGRDYLLSIVSASYADAVSIDGKLSLMRTKIFGGGPHTGWDASLFSVLSMQIGYHRHIAETMKESLNHSGNISLLSPSNPQYLYFDSFIVPSVYTATSSCFQVEFEYDNTLNWRDDYYSWISDYSNIRHRQKSGSVDALVHIPTCFHHKKVISDWIRGNFNNFYEIPSLNWDVPVKDSYREKLVPLSTQVTDEILKTSEKYANEAVFFYQLYLSKIISDMSVLNKQISYIKKRLFYQAVTYLNCRSVINETVSLVTTDHEINIRGPLFSAARDANSRIHIFPHSSITVPLALLPHKERVNLYQSRTRSGSIYTVVGERLNPIVMSELTSAQRQIDLSPISRNDRTINVCLLLNSMYCNSGGYYFDVFDLRNVYNEVKAFCDKKGWSLSIRPKPSGVAPNVLSKALNVTLEDLIKSISESIEVVAQRTHICINFGERTTALNVFQEFDSKIILYSSIAYPDQYFTTTDVDYIECDDIIKLISNLENISKEM
jgi:protein O-GlcNAc transferase